LLQIKDIDKAHYEDILGQLFFEYNFGDEDDLYFEADFESSNIALVTKDMNGCYNIELSGDTNSVGQTEWFYFKISGGEVGKAYNFRIINITRQDMLFNEGMKPCIFSKKSFKKKNEGWQRGGDFVMFYQNNENLASLDHTTRLRNVNKNCLEFSYTPKYARDTISFAMNFPYTYEMLQKDCEKWDKRSKKLKNL